MKYTVSWETERGISYLHAINNAGRKFKESGTIIATMLLSNAKLYDSRDAASAIMVYIHKARVPGEIYEIDDKTLFNARLKGI
jgi:hypothetical protein